jgi:hypothetical protein
MNTELSKNLKCILMRNGIELWLEEEFIESVKNVLLKGGESKLLKIGEQFINTADVSGIFDAKTMEDNWYKKNGYWKCKQGNYWHKRNEECGHK